MDITKMTVEELLKLQVAEQDKIIAALAQLQQAQQRYTAQLARVEAFEQGATQEAEQLRRSAEEAFLNGQIDRLEWSLLTGQSITLSMEYLDALRALGRASIELNAFNEQ